MFYTEYYWSLISSLLRLLIVVLLPLLLLQHFRLVPERIRILLQQHKHNV